MAAISLGAFGYRSLLKKGTACDGQSLSMQKVAGNGSNRASVSICSYANYPENQKKNGGSRKTIKPKIDFIKKGLQLRWWFPLFRRSADKIWAEEGGSSEQSVETAVVQDARKAPDHVRVIDEDESSGRRQAKNVAVSFTAEKAKLLRKTLRSTSSFHDLMYHSAIASRLASAESVESSVVPKTRKAIENESKSSEEGISVRRQSKNVAVSFTPEKAKLLRKALRSTSTFHDPMYHSAIASRLASAESSSDE